MSGSDLSFAQDETYIVRPSEIESVLQRLWNEANGEGAETSVMQVRTLNLLVFVPAAHADADTLRAIDIAAVQHPGRTITMIVTDDEQAPVANVAIACRLGNSGKQLCGEQITITSGSGGAPLPSLAASLIVAGLPVFLWWHGDPPFAAPIFDSFVEIADRVIVDSQTWQNPFATLRALARNAAQHAPHIAYTDLHWTRLTPWRRMTAQCFDMPGATPELYRLRQVTIEHAPDDHDYVTALLFVGWLASGLDGAVAWTGDQQIALRSGQTAVTIELRKREGSAGIHRVTLRSADAEFAIEHRPETGCLRTEIALPGSTPIERMASLASQPLEQVIGDELNMLEHDRHFERALRIAASLVAQ
ncbi:MAG TPA: glucose-6-phosphate dehydrogenase assembly protein OpcA [Herpetosiphonaceae bacterium]